jgi:hypothetical protein
MNREFNLTKRVQNRAVGFAGMGILRSCSARGHSDMESTMPF